MNQSGGGAPLPSVSASWGQEIDLDLAMVSAACPTCKILLVEASNTNVTSLGTARQHGRRSRGLGSVEQLRRPGGSLRVHRRLRLLQPPGVAITASAGDSGYEVNYPAASPYVIAVGGPA